MSLIRHAFLTTIVLAALPSAVQADVSLPSFFSNDMVLQQGQPLPVWGWAEPGEKVTVEIKDQKESTVAGPDGKWRIELKAMPASFNPVTLRVYGKNRLEFGNVLVGEVWLCAGGLNMEVWPVYQKTQILNYDQEVAAAKYPDIRFFTVPHAASLIPQDKCGGKWRPISPESFKECSATAYFFGRSLRREVKVPIGIMIAAWDNTKIEAWTSYNALKPQPDFQEIAGKAEQDALNIDKIKADHEKAIENWKRQELDIDPCGKAGSEKPAFDDHSWKTTQLPLAWSKDPDLKSLAAGIVWYRRTVEIPATWKDVKGNLTLELGVLDDEDITFINGEEIGRSDSYVWWRNYQIPEKAWTSNRQSLSIAVRILNIREEAGFSCKPAAMKVYPAGKPDLAIPLAGDWRRSDLMKFGKRPKVPQKPPALSPADPLKNPLSVLHNGMIQPLIPYGIRGVIWSQGEANRVNANSYVYSFPALVADWRTRWGSDLPVYYTQLAPFNYKDDFSTGHLQGIQASMMGVVPNCGMACTVDIGNSLALAYPNKQEAGRRLALWALAKTYGRSEIICSGPSPLDMQVKDGKARIRFRDTDGILVVNGQTISGFSISGAEDVFMPAEARLDGDAVVVWNKLVANPTKVRYGGQEYASKVNLTNATGLPTLPFTIMASPTATHEGKIQ